MEENDQHLTLKLKDYPTDPCTFITSLYAKGTTRQRIIVYNLFNGPWCIGGEFNVIMDPTEKLGGIPHRAYRSLDFISTMGSYGFIGV
ncbi:hypothetical protein KY284_000869 [Solanum tuberosum]|nr:hypothetical protein KY284_000869 [Solanum tuberosum]